MCPPAKSPVADIGLFWSDDEIFSLLDKYSCGSCLPNNVLAEASPYLYPPSNLPEGIWYLVRSKEKKESGFGFWRAKGEARKIYSNSAISGWRTTLEYFEGQAPNEHRTEWLMQEYKITQNGLYDTDKPKDTRSLCRVFLSSGHNPKIEVNSGAYKIINKSQRDPAAPIIPGASVTHGQDATSESKDKKTSKTELLPSADEQRNSSMEVFSSDLECLLRGDYLELNDLEDPESHSSSSQNSSCPSKLSDEYFDSLALLRDLEEDFKYMQENQSSSKYCFPTSVRPNDVVTKPPPSGFTVPICTSVAESPQTCPTVNELCPETRILDHNTKRLKPEGRRGGTSSSSDAASSSPDQKIEMPNQERKSGSSKKKKLKLYFCFRPF